MKEEKGKKKEIRGEGGGKDEFRKGEGILFLSV